MFPRLMLRIYSKISECTGRYLRSGSPFRRAGLEAGELMIVSLLSYFPFPSHLHFVPDCVAVDFDASPIKSNPPLNLAQCLVTPAHTSQAHESSLCFIFLPLLEHEPEKLVRPAERLFSCFETMSDVCNLPMWPHSPMTVSLLIR